jgi:5,5'-dehydrodivanillate O-demethylase
VSRPGSGPGSSEVVVKAGFKEKVRLKAYPVEAKAGLLWAYMGPAPVPLVPDWEPFTHRDGYVDICISELLCNWFQCQENSVDPVHVQWLHAYWAKRLDVKSAFGAPPKHLKIGTTPFEQGLIYRRIVEGSTEEDEDWATGRVCLFPYALFVGHTYACHFEWRVPIYDERTLSVMWFINRVAPGHEAPKQGRIPYWYGGLYDDSGRFRTSHVVNQDIVAWVNQGVALDRTRERLGASDAGVIAMRKMLQQEARVVADGGDPRCVFRDPEQNRGVKLPLHGFNKTIAIGDSASSDPIPFQHGEPQEAIDAIREVSSTWKDL